MVDITWYNELVFMGVISWFINQSSHHWGATTLLSCPPWVTWKCWCDQCDPRILRAIFSQDLETGSRKCDSPISRVPINSMYGIFTYIWEIFRANVGKYAMHGEYGVYDKYDIANKAIIWRSTKKQLLTGGQHYGKLAASVRFSSESACLFFSTCCFSKLVQVVQKG